VIEEREEETLIVVTWLHHGDPAGMAARSPGQASIINHAATMRPQAASLVFCLPTLDDLLLPVQALIREPSGSPTTPQILFRPPLLRTMRHGFPDRQRLPLCAGPRVFSPIEHGRKLMRCGEIVV
jgi:hypothetical protein